MKIVYRQAARDDVVRQFRYYLLTMNLPDTAIRFRRAVRHTFELLRQRPAIGSRYRTDHPRLQGLRSWPVGGFEAIRIYYLYDQNIMDVVRVLHGKRDVELVLLNPRSLPPEG